MSFYYSFWTNDSFVTKPSLIVDQLKFNDAKTEALLFPFFSSLKPSTVSLPDSITLGAHNIL